MNDVPRQMLREIVARYGKSIVEERERCKGLLLDYCSTYRRETNVLIAVLDENVAREMLNVSTSTSTSLQLTRMVQRVCDDRGLDKDAARWGVESWALALDIKVDTDTPVIRTTKPDPSPTRPAPNSFEQSTPVSTYPNPTTPINTQPPAPLQSQHTLQQSTPLPPYSRSVTSSNTRRPIQAQRTTIQRPGQTQTTPIPLRRSSRQPGFLVNLLIVALGLGIFVLGARTFVLPLGQDLWPAAIYLSTVLIGYKRALLSYVLYIAAGTVGLPVFAGPYPLWQWNGLLIFVSGQERFFSPYFLYYYLSVIVLLIVGALFQSTRSKTIWVTFGILLLGNLLFASLLYVISLVFPAGETIGPNLAAFVSNSLILDSIIMLVILFILIYTIRVIKS